MSKINKGRMTAPFNEKQVVFLIGMRINNWLAVHRWVPVFMAMGRMLPELYKNPSLGFKSYEMAIGRTLILVQYWSNTEQLIEYAKMKDSEHLPAWRAFNKAAQKSSAVGIWHETYEVQAGASENVYHNMPAFGFGKVGRLEPAVGKRNSASQRLSR